MFKSAPLIIFLAAAFYLFALFGPVQVAMAKDATVFTNADIITMDPGNPRSESVAVADGKIIAVGNKDAVMKAAGAGAKVVDLGGKTLMPGFIDPHSHVFLNAIKITTANLSPVPVGPVKNMAQLQAQLTKWKKEHKVKPGGWILGMGYDDTAIAEKRHPTRQDLDKVSTENPILIVHISAHLVAMNSLGLKTVGITKDTPNPAGGVIRREAGSQEPNGVLEEHAAMMALAKLPPPPPDKAEKAIVKSLEDYTSKGVTTAQEGAVTGSQLIRLFRDMGKKGMLPIDVIGFAVYEGADKTLANFERDKKYLGRFRVAGLKLVLDGSIQGYSAYLSKPYYVQPKSQHAVGDTQCNSEDRVKSLLLPANDQGGQKDAKTKSISKGYRGYPAFEKQEDLTNWVRKAYKNGWQIEAHTNGDAATDMLLAAVKDVSQGKSVKNQRTIIVHAQTMREDQLDDAKKLGMLITFFPCHVYYWGDRHRDIFLGPKRAARINPTNSALKRGIIFTIHNDAPVVPMNSLLDVWAAVNRVTSSGKKLGPEQCIPVMEALKGITINGAYQVFEEKRKGSLETGKLADLVVLSANPLKVDPMKIKDIQVLATIKESKTVYSRK